MGQDVTIKSSQKGRPLTEEERFFVTAAFKNVVESIKSIEETAKFLVGATATTSGLFLAAAKISFGESANSEPTWLIPFTAWAISIIVLILVLYPLPYWVEKQRPLAMKKAFSKALKVKYSFLAIGALSFLFGVMYSIIILIF